MQIFLFFSLVIAGVAVMFALQNTDSTQVRFLAWDFNDVDISAARDPLNRIYFWVSVDGVPTDSNVWAHGADARTIFPQPDVLTSCE